MNVKLNVSSSSFGRRIRKEGGPSLAGDASGSWMYSITLSSPNSLLGLNLVAGKAFGVMFRSVRPRALVMLQPAMETGSC
jgi:hypothetical protein